MCAASAHHASAAGRPARAAAAIGPPLGSNALRAAQVTLVSQRDTRALLGDLAGARRLARLSVLHVRGNPLSRAELGAAADVSRFGAAICVLDQSWVRGQPAVVPRPRYRFPSAVSTMSALLPYSVCAARALLLGVHKALERLQKDSCVSAD